MMTLLLLACGEVVTVTPSQSGCTNFSYQDPAAPEIGWVTQGDGVMITRENILLEQSGLAFSPEVAIENGVMTLREWWLDGETDDQFCYTASAYVRGWQGELEVRWYVGDEEIPVRTLLLDE